MPHQHVRPSLRKQPSARVCLTALFGIDPAARNDSNRLMNGSEPQIEIFKPFSEAFELMKKILFQPFDLKKWLVIGFAAFLAALSGGFSSSFNPMSRWSSREDNKAIAQSFQDVWSAGHLEWWMITLIAVGALIILAVVLALMWVGARGRFIFTDCIVHNRG